MKTRQGNETLLSKARSDGSSGQRRRHASVLQGSVQQHKDFGFYFSMWNRKSLEDCKQTNDLI